MESTQRSRSRSGERLEEKNETEKEIFISPSSAIFTMKEQGEERGERRSMRSAAAGGGGGGGGEERGMRQDPEAIRATVLDDSPYLMHEPQARTDQIAMATRISSRSIAPDLSLSARFITISTSASCGDGQRMA